MYFCIKLDFSYHFSSKIQNYTRPCRSFRLTLVHTFLACCAPLSDKTHFYQAHVTLKDFECEAEKKQAEAVQLELKMNEMEKVMKNLEQRSVMCTCMFTNTSLLICGLCSGFCFLYYGCNRLQNSEQACQQSDQSDQVMRVQLEGKVDALQKQLADLDTLRLRIKEKLKKYLVSLKLR